MPVPLKSGERPTEKFLDWVDKGYFDEDTVSRIGFTKSVRPELLLDRNADERRTAF